MSFGTTSLLLFSWPSGPGVRSNQMLGSRLLGDNTRRIGQVGGAHVEQAIEPTSEGLAGPKEVERGPRELERAPKGAEDSPDCVEGRISDDVTRRQFAELSLTWLYPNTPCSRPIASRRSAGERHTQARRKPSAPGPKKAPGARPTRV
jgi:hypothetical protein